VGPDQVHCHSKRHPFPLPVTAYNL